MFQKSYGFREPSGLFPRFIAVVAIVSALILLFRSYLPEPLKSLTEDTGDVFGAAEEELEEVNEKGIDDHAQQPAVSDTAESEVTSIRSLLANKRFRLSSLTGGYILLSYLIGFLWATPVFVIVYSLSVGHQWYITAGLTVATYFLVYAFIPLLNVQLNSGVLFG